VGFGAGRVLLGLSGRPRRFRRWASCSAMACWSQAHPRLLWEGRHLTGAPAGLAAIAECDDQDCLAAALDALLVPAGRVGMIMAGFVPNSGHKRSKNQSGRPDLNRRPLDPQECIHIPATRPFSILAGEARAQVSRKELERAAVSARDSHFVPSCQGRANFTCRRHQLRPLLLGRAQHNRLWLTRASLRNGWVVSVQDSATRSPTCEIWLPGDGRVCGGAASLLPAEPAGSMHAV